MVGAVGSLFPPAILGSAAVGGLAGGVIGHRWEGDVAKRTHLGSASSLIMSAMAPVAGEAHRWAAATRRLLPAVVFLALAGMLGWVVLGPDEDPTAKALADHVAREACGPPDGLLGGSAVIEDEAVPAIDDPAARLAARRADRIAHIACEDGVVDAGTYLLAFATSADLDAALVTIARSAPAGRLCLLDSELFTPGFGSGGAFEATCSALDGVELGGVEPTLKRRPDDGRPAPPAQRRSM